MLSFLEKTLERIKDLKSCVQHGEGSYVDKEFKSIINELEEEIRNLKGEFNETD